MLPQGGQYESIANFNRRYEHDDHAYLTHHFTLKMRDKIIMDFGSLCLRLNGSFYGLKFVFVLFQLNFKTSLN